MAPFKDPLNFDATDRANARTHAQAETANRLLSSCSIGRGKENPRSSLNFFFNRFAGEAAGIMESRGIFLCVPHCIDQDDGKFLFHGLSPKCGFVPKRVTAGLPIRASGVMPMRAAELRRIPAKSVCQWNLRQVKLLQKARPRPGCGLCLGTTCTIFFWRTGLNLHPDHPRRRRHPPVLRALKARGRASGSPRSAQYHRQNSGRP